MLKNFSNLQSVGSTDKIINLKLVQFKFKYCEVTKPNVFYTSVIDSLFQQFQASTHQKGVFGKQVTVYKNTFSCQN